MRVNAEAPAEIADWAARRAVRLIHFSTDYVFSGREPGLKTEDDPPEPLSVYGRSKLAGEQAVLSRRGNLVVRVSWVFGPEKPSFVDQIHDAALAGKPLAAIADKFSLPTCTADLAPWIGRLLETDAAGIVHACNPGEPVSWQGMAEAVVREMAARGIIAACPAIAARTLAEMKDFRADRPRHTAMDTRRLALLLGSSPRPWPEALADHVRSRAKGH
jgi:dTDP-4-dehydrorhamnose reductase